MSDENKRNLRGKFGPAILTEPGDYGTITANGPFTAQESFTVESLKVNGPVMVSHDAVIENGKVNGPATFRNNVTIKDTLKINGPLTIDGEFLILDRVKVNGPLKCENNISGKDTGKITVNGPLSSEKVSNLEQVYVRGPLKANQVDQVEKLKVSGRLEVPTIKANDIRILLSGNTSIIGSIEADQVEIGTELDDEFFVRSKSLIIGKLIKKFTQKEPGYAEIDEIRTTGIVEIDHVKVKKVYAKELFVGEETEVGEFIELKEA